HDLPAVTPPGGRPRFRPGRPLRPTTTRVSTAKVPEARSWPSLRARPVGGPKPEYPMSTDTSSMPVSQESAAPSPATASGDSPAAVSIRPMAKRITATQAAMSPFLSFYADSAWSKRDPHDPATCDFVLGNPHEMPLPGFVSSLRGGVEPKNADWFAYKLSEPASRGVIAASLRRHHGLPFQPEDVLMTNGAFAAIAVSLCALLDPGDEVVVVTPSWFFYEAMIVAYGGTPVTVRADRDTHDLDLGAIEAAINERTKAIIVNSPNNPTGKIYPPETLK